ncbi:hypothetical protein GCM10010393_56920 [Streptomyces gobitricini]|uniref:Uncharacterized protein n=1 Tax=Streptomyces gobitricini TaxID=68211 RepID=A0ABP6AG58_9ACTN
MSATYADATSSGSHPSASANASTFSSAVNAACGGSGGTDEGLGVTDGLEDAAVGFTLPPSPPPPHPDSDSTAANPTATAPTPHVVLMRRRIPARTGRRKDNPHIGDHQ